ncbi:bifunctional N-acetylglucosamine-1-phosphate uridyltransferase/glucosamine-1-phosphate acetyltransferase [Planctomycetales bacterium ZRK34]|nr:bifunctional N-acetylglucosamine-1-phosphate uridyltransferase/glucosamine-1-phosphate acetyltransferase [Planctomycetales bacterium ZRK34]
MTDSIRQSADRPLEAIILAAGKGTRMGSDLAKVLHPVADRPMVQWVIDACEAAGTRRVIVVVGHQAEAVREALADRDNVEFVEQTEQLGTGHAVMMAAPLYPADQRDCDVLVLCGDGPLISDDTLKTLVTTHREADACATLATSVIEDATGYGRIVRHADGRFQRIVEHKDATDAERQIREINPSYYCFRAADLFRELDRIDNDNAKGEYYLTDVLGLLTGDGKTVQVVDAVPPQDVLSINTPQQLAEVDALLRRRLGMEIHG